MAKPKAPRWLTEAFAEGVSEHDQPNGIAPRVRPYPGAWPLCWLAQFDPVHHPCESINGPGLERFHFIPRQRVEAAMWEQLREARIYNDPLFAEPIWKPLRDELVLLAAWDSRNGGLGCEHHHRRLDGHACSPRAPRIVIHYEALPARVPQFAFDYGIDEQLNRFPSSI